MRTGVLVLFSDSRLSPSRTQNPLCRVLFTSLLLTACALVVYESAFLRCFCLPAASEQRVVSISGREAASATVSPAAEALVLCAAPILQEEGDLQKVVRLVVPSSQVKDCKSSVVAQADSCFMLFMLHCCVQSLLLQLLVAVFIMPVISVV